MGSAYTPEVASSNTSSPVRQPKQPTIGTSPLGMGKMAGPLKTGLSTGVAKMPSMPKAPSAKSFATPTHSYAGGEMGAKITHEQRQGAALPHMSMHPGA